MMGKMEEEFNELRLEQHQEFEANREELKVQVFLMAQRFPLHFP